MSSRKDKPVRKWSLQDWTDEAKELQNLVWWQNREINKLKTTHQGRVHEMMVALAIPLLNEDMPRVDNLNFDLLRALVEEEAREFDAAMLDIEDALELEDEGMLLKAWAEVIDAICDIDVVIHNTSNAMGIDIEPFFQEVHRSNMAKADGPTREDGKKLKPKGWKPPRIREMLEEVLSGAVKADGALGGE